MLGSPSIKEGVSLLRVSQVHILEPYWNMSRLLQVIGRAFRFCSHKDVPKEKRVVEVLLYVAYFPKELKVTDSFGLSFRDHTKLTVDQYIWELAKEKDKVIQIFEKAMKEMAIDCDLLYNVNVYNKNEALHCAK
jgi:superfamily II DNA or RNA helicase